MANSIRIQPRGHRFRQGVLLLILACISGAAVLWLIINDLGGGFLQIAAGVIFTISLLSFLALILDPDNRTAQQSAVMLTLASRTLEYLMGGMTDEGAQQVCELLLPRTSAIAVAIADTSRMMGYAGYGMPREAQGDVIRAAAINNVLADGKERLFYSNEEIGVPLTSARMNAYIVEPLYIGRKITGALMLCYRRPRQLNQTELSIARGMARLLSTQLSAAALEEQTKLATSMELKMLQAQINPHFLFNTINTIASFIRTDPNQARQLLREFAVFYRSTLEDANDLIPLEREIEQVKRYFSFEVARFGKERLSLEVNIQPDVYKTMVPSFMIQPLVENSVQHAMKSEGKLTVRVEGRMTEEEIIISVTDDGAGMSEEKLRTMMDPASSQGLGIAVKNVHDRMKGYFGAESRMDINSKLDRGTTVTFTLQKGPVGSFVMTDGTQELALGHT